MQSWIFSIITTVFSVTWSSEIIILWSAAQETFIIIVINVEYSFVIKYFILFFRILWWTEYLKEQLLFEIFCRSDQFNTSLLNNIYI